MFRVDSHIWKTSDGRLVEHGDPDAAFLAFAAGQEVPDDIARRSGLVAFRARAKPADKAMGKPADKAVSKPTDKSGGVTVNKIN